MLLILSLTSDDPSKRPVQICLPELDFAKLEIGEDLEIKGAVAVKDGKIVGEPPTEDMDAAGC